jgi:hypothetical protein
MPPNPYDDDRIKKDEEKIRYRLDNPDAPPNPDMNKNKSSWKHSKSMTVTSGRICFGWNHEVQSGANEDVMTFEDAIFYYGDNDLAALPHNTVAKNGTWLAYPLVDRDPIYDKDDFYRNKPLEDRIAGWFICHQNIQDPVREVCNMIYNTLDSDNGGNYKHWSYIKKNGSEEIIKWGLSNRTHAFHAALGYILMPRYSMGCDTPADLTEEEKAELRNDGLHVVDYAVAKRDRSTWAENGVCNIFTYGDFVIGRLKYDNDGLCDAFLLTGTAAQFQHIHFTTEGTAPLGRTYVDSDDDDDDDDDESISEELQGEDRSNRTAFASRLCNRCGDLLPKSEFSKSQWSKKKDGKFVSKCKGCIDFLQVERVDKESRIELVEKMICNIQQRLISSLGDGYDDESLKRLDKKMRDYYLEEDDFYYDEEWCQNEKSSNPEKPTAEEMQQYKKSTTIRLRCLRDTRGYEQTCNRIRGESYKNIDLYQALYDDLLSYYYIWFEIIFKEEDRKMDLYSACATMIDFASVKLELGLKDMNETKRIMLLLDELKHLFQSTIQEDDDDWCDHAGVIEYDFYEICYAFAIELADADMEDDAEDYFEKAFSAENCWGYYEDMHCGKLLEFATGRDFSNDQRFWSVEDYAMSNYGFYYKCLKAYANNQRGTVPMPNFDDAPKNLFDSEVEEEALSSLFHFII